MRKRHRLLAVAGVVAAVSVAVAVTVAVILPNLGRQDGTEASVSLRRVDPPPEVAYSVTSEDLVQYPLLERILSAFGNPDCCREARMFDGTLFFAVDESEVMALHIYLVEQYEALDPPPTSYTVALEFEGIHYSWDLGVQTS